MISIGIRFTRWLVFNIGTPGYANRPRWWCRCDCGKEKEVYAESLIRGKSLSCGCLRQERSVAATVTHGFARGPKKTRTYKSWQKMKERCFNKNCKAYPDYGGGNITVCDRWVHSFENFLADMGERPIGKCIERLNNDGIYEPDNCVWDTRKAQANNRRSSRILEFNGESKTMTQWGEFLGINPKTIWKRLDDGWSIEKSLTY